MPKTEKEYADQELVMAAIVSRLQGVAEMQRQLANSLVASQPTSFRLQRAVDIDDVGACLRGVSEVVAIMDEIRRDTCRLGAMNGMTLRDMAHDAGVAHSTIHKWILTIENAVTPRP